MNKKQILVIADNLNKQGELKLASEVRALTFQDLKSKTLDKTLESLKDLKDNKIKPFLENKNLLVYDPNSIINKNIKNKLNIADNASKTIKINMEEIDTILQLIKKAEERLKICSSDLDSLFFNTNSINRGLVKFKKDLIGIKKDLAKKKIYTVTNYKLFNGEALESSLKSISDHIENIKATVYNVSYIIEYYAFMRIYHDFEEFLNENKKDLCDIKSYHKTIRWLSTNIKNKIMDFPKPRITFTIPEKFKESCSKYAQLIKRLYALGEMLYEKQGDLEWALTPFYESGSYLEAPDEYALVDDDDDELLDMPVSKSIKKKIKF